MAGFNWFKRSYEEPNEPEKEDVVEDTEEAGEEEAAPDEAEGMKGLPGSPGKVTAEAFIVRSIEDFDRFPDGAILVARTTNPAWTPLFLAAGGLVMEVGGMMTHGSVVAREYGIPAVVGVNQATIRLKTGQRIRVDGSTGRITMLGEQ